MNNRVILCILDGFGIRKETANNGLVAAHFWETLVSKYPYTEIEASEEFVGLPQGQMGNSEVGHTTIGAGRIIPQELDIINQVARQNLWHDNETIQQFIGQLKSTGGSCHLMGLFSKGGVHSHRDHFISIIKFLKSQGIKTHLHLFLDGRDTPPKSALEELDALDPFWSDDIYLATLSGRYYAMDRDNRWERTKQAFEVIVQGASSSLNKTFTHAKTYIQDSYNNQITDEFISPASSENYGGFQTGDGFWHVNFRPDRVRQLYSSLVDSSFNDFERPLKPKFCEALGMSPYSENLDKIVHTIFTKVPPHNTLGEVVSNQGLYQTRIAETEKYPHVTFFLNGGREEPFKNESRLLIPSPKVATYDLQPEMSAPEVCEAVLESLGDKNQNLIVVNFANTDMVGHTALPDAILKAVQTVDLCLTKIYQAAQEHEVTLIITADHGNAEMMVDEHGQPHTAHTCNPVPFLVVPGTPNPNLKLEKQGTLADVAPTVLQLLGIPQPKEMTGQSLCASF